MVCEIKSVFNDVYDIEYVFSNDLDAVRARIWFVQNHEEQMRQAW